MPSCWRPENCAQCYGFDRYLMALMLTILLAALFPARGTIAEGPSQITFWAVALLFFLYGATLSLVAIWAGLPFRAACPQPAALAAQCSRG